MRHVTKRQVVGGNQANGAAIQKATQHGGGADEPIVRIGAVEELVEEEQKRYGTDRKIGKLPDPRDLCVETRAPLLQRILDAKSGTDRQRCDSKRSGPHRS